MYEALSVTVTWYNVVISGVANGLAILGLLSAAGGVQEKLYGGVPPIIELSNCEDCPRQTVSGLAVAIASGKTLMVAMRL